MFSFRSISLVATLAFAAFSSAVPLEGVNGLVARQGNLEGLGDAVGAVSVIEPVLDSVNVVDRRGDQQVLGVGDYYKKCSDGIADIIVNIDGALKVEPVKVDVVVGLLGEVVILLDALVVDLKTLLGVDADVYCLSAGLVLTLDAIALLVCGLLKLVLDLLCVVLKVIAYAECSDVVVKISACLLLVLQVTVKVVVGLLPTILLVVGSLLVDLQFLLGDLNILAFLGLCDFLGLKL